MKKYIILLTIPLLFSIGCNSDDENENQNIIDQNLFGTFESQLNFEVNENELYFNLLSTCENEFIQVSQYDQKNKITIQFSHPNNYVINSEIYNVLSSGTFYTENNSIFFNGSFKDIFVDSQGTFLGEYFISNINFQSNYNIFLSELSVSEFVVNSNFETNTGNFIGSEDCFLLISNTSLESHINNTPLYLDNREYIKVN